MSYIKASFTSLSSTDRAPRENLCLAGISPEKLQWNRVITKELRDEITVRFDWTYGGPNFDFAVAIRHHCLQFCRCRPDDARKKRKIDLDINSRLAATEADDGSLDLANKKTKRIIFKILPPQPNSAPGSNPSGTCGKNKDNFCRHAWDAKIWGPLVENPDLKDQGTCGNKCSGPQDCSGTTDQTCSCVIPGPREAGKLGYDPIFPPSVCLALIASTARLTSHLGGKRDIESMPFIDVEGNHVQCVCNATYVSPSCCGSQNGMIWQDVFPNSYPRLSERTLDIVEQKKRDE